MSPYFYLFLVFPLTFVAIGIFKLCKSLYIRYLLLTANKINDTDFTYLTFFSLTLYDEELEKFLNKYIFEVLDYSNEMERLKKEFQEKLENEKTDKYLAEIYPHFLIYCVKKNAKEKYLIDNIVENREDRNFVIKNLHKLMKNVEEMRANSEIIRRKDYNEMKNFLMNSINSYDEIFLM